MGDPKGSPKSRVILFLFAAASLSASLAGCKTQVTTLRKFATPAPDSGIAGVPPGLTSLTIQDASPTNHRPLSLHWGLEVGTHDTYCILENSTDSNACVWRSGPLPAAYLDSAGDGTLVLSAYLRNAFGTSTVVDSNAITTDHTPPSLASANVTNPSLTNSPVFGLTYGAITDSYSAYCVQPNNPAVSGCNWISGALPSSFAIVSGDGPYVLTVWIRDTAGNVSLPVDTPAVFLDTGVPSVSISAPAAGSFSNAANVAAFTVSGSCSENGRTVQISGAVTSSATCTAGAWSAALDLSGISEGSFTLWADQSDGAGNAAPTATRSFVKDTLAPSVASIAVTNASPTNTRDFALSFGSQTGSFSSYCIGENDAALADCATWVSASSLPSTYRTSATNGSKVLTLWLKDDAANVSSGIDSNAVILDTSFVGTVPFDALSDSNYAFDSSKIDLTGGVGRLTPRIHVDDSGATAGFGGGTASGMIWDATNAVARLGNDGACDGQTTNCESASSTWTPKWASLLGYWGFNESAGTIANNDPIAASAGSAATAKNANGAGMAYSSGKVRSGITFDGTDDFISTPVTSADLTGGFTLSIWEKTAAFGQPYAWYFGTASTAGAYGYFQCGKRGGGGEIRFETGDFTTNTVLDTSNIDSNYSVVTDDQSWHHVVCVWDKANSSKSIYVDGVRVANVAATATGTYPNYGAVYVGNNVAGEHWNGALDEAAIWNVALTASEIKTIYAHQYAKYRGSLFSRVMDAGVSGAATAIWRKLDWRTPLPFGKNLPDYNSTVQNETSSDYSALVGSAGAVGNDNLMSGNIGVWHLDETTAGTAPGGNDFRDGSASANHGKASGTTAFGVASPLGAGARISGGTSGVALTNAIALSGDFTLAGWVMLTRSGGGTNGDILFGSSGCATGCTNFYAGKYRLYTGSADAIVASTASAVYAWSHYVLTRVGTTLKLYIDGVQNATGTWSGTPTFTYILSQPTASSYGRYDEVAIWNRGLTAGEIAQLHRRGLSRMKFQIRTCALSDCSDGVFLGPDGTPTSSFGELNNNSVPSTGLGLALAGPPSLTFSDFVSPPSPNRYFQYVAVAESAASTTTCDYGSGASTCSAELQRVAISPTHYERGGTPICYKTGFAFGALTGFSATAGPAGCGGARFALSLDQSSWYYWSGSAWAVADGSYSQASDAATVNTRIASFATQIGVGTLYLRAFLYSSDGETPCELDEVRVTGTN